MWEAEAFWSVVFSSHRELHFEIDRSRFAGTEFPDYSGNSIFAPSLS